MNHHTPRDYSLKIKIEDIVSADEQQFNEWIHQLKTHVNHVLSLGNASHRGNAVSAAQINAWQDCFHFIASNLSALSSQEQEYELIFEYSMPGTLDERPDILLLTQEKVISLEFKHKAAPQMDENRDDVAQAIHYKEWLEHHHDVTKQRSMTVISYLVCTHQHALTGEYRGIQILTKDNFASAMTRELLDQNPCDFSDEWLSSPKSEMPDMLKAIEIMYRQGNIPYISDVNKACLERVLWYINCAEKPHTNRTIKALILINGVPGAGKTAVGQSIVYEMNNNGQARSVYLSGNGPLVEVLRYQIDKIGKDKHLSENAIDLMANFKRNYYFRDQVPQQSVLIFDEAQRAWDAQKVGKGISEPDILLSIGDRIAAVHKHVVLVGLYGNGQVIHEGEEAGLTLWDDALKKHNDWYVFGSKELLSGLTVSDRKKKIDDAMFLPVSLRADFVDCSRWVEATISRKMDPVSQLAQAKQELEKLQQTSMQILVTRDFRKIQEKTRDISTNNPDRKFGILVSNFTSMKFLNTFVPGVTRSAYRGDYGAWFDSKCRNLNMACSVYGNQGLELDCPIVVFGNDYVRANGKWVATGYKYRSNAQRYKDPETIVENNYRVLLTRARKQMILFIPNVESLDETYDYFIRMGMDTL